VLVGRGGGVCESVLDMYAFVVEPTIVCVSTNMFLHYLSNLSY
jgi:hypothetical protein